MLCKNCHSWHRKKENVPDNYPFGNCFSEKAMPQLVNVAIPEDFGCVHFRKWSDDRLRHELSQKIISEVISALSSECVIPIDDAEFIVYRISCGKIPHISINF